ncbi:hypothetical protein A2801_00820 [Candidatus Woesebacteria bacterium RIFCSPHIGHO2_01_FULL_41_10]|uniref:DUF4352 domain-containing protein n=1 Tax=Candidatus Woesebacteria bacterium RIFCSPHIGHO2_01_FULL_41_10 TaxID=1802500 RepID=A0A1F7YPT2_9BACT|nr:MAG: hypothetical protein A2801_00820 [Candidatus Woesebacteria bacterium RIFCSPHIGHO2_01_FULL_41_10]
MADRFRNSATNVLQTNVGRIGVGVVALILLFVVIKAFGSNAGNPDVQGTASTDKVELTAPDAMQEINKEISFPITDNTGEEVGRVKMVLATAELRDEIIVKGKKASAVSGRTFLVLNIKVTNSFDKSIEVNTKDYFRVAVNGDESEWLAPDIHNDPVKIQAISTKPTRVAFPVDENIRSFILQIGEIKGEKEKVNLELQ